MANGKTWRARELFERLDELTGTGIPMCLNQKHAHEHGFQDMRWTWDDLGVNTRNNRVSLSDDAPLKEVRTAIMKG
jgi:hypothetical protein